MSITNHDDHDDDLDDFDDDGIDKIHRRCSCVFLAASVVVGSQLHVNSDCRHHEEVSENILAESTLYQVAACRSESVLNSKLPKPPANQTLNPKP